MKILKEWFSLSKPIMNVQDILIQALNEPRNYTQWYREAVRLRKEREQTLSKATFNEAKKPLESQRLVISKKVNGREKQFSINPDRIVDYKAIKDIEQEAKKTLARIQRLLEDQMKMDEKTRKYLVNSEDIFETFAYEIHQKLLRQSWFSLMLNEIPNSDLRRPVLEECIKILNATLESMRSYLDRLDFNLVNSIFSVVGNRIVSEMNKVEVPPPLPSIQKYIQKMERNLRLKKTDQRGSRASKHC